MRVDDITPREAAPGIALKITGDGLNRARAVAFPRHGGGRVRGLVQEKDRTSAIVVVPDHAVTGKPVVVGGTISPVEILLPEPEMAEPHEPHPGGPPPHSEETPHARWWGMRQYGGGPMTDGDEVPEWSNVAGEVQVHYPHSHAGIGGTVQHIVRYLREHPISGWKDTNYNWWEAVRSPIKDNVWTSVLEFRQETQPGKNQFIFRVGPKNADGSIAEISFTWFGVERDRG